MGFVGTGRRRVAIATTAFVIALLGAACAPLTGVDRSPRTVTTGSYLIGPFDLAAKGQPGWQSEASRGGVPRPSGTFGIKTLTFDVVDAQGDPVPRADVHLHHVLLMDQRPDLLCPGRANRFAGAGMERTPLRLPDGYEYLVGATDRWSALWHLMNQTDGEQTVFIRYTIGYDTSADATNTRGVESFFMDVTGCGNSEYDVPGDGGPGSVHTKSRTWSAPWDGIAVYSAGHIHPGGIDIAVERVSDGTVGCTSTAQYAPSGMLDSITPCPMHLLVEEGEQYRVTARYHDDAPVLGAMGIMLTYVWPGTPPAE